MRNSTSSESCVHTPPRLIREKSLQIFFKKTALNFAWKKSKWQHHSTNNGFSSYLYSLQYCCVWVYSCMESFWYEKCINPSKISISWHIGQVYSLPAKGYCSSCTGPKYDNSCKWMLAIFSIFINVDPVCFKIFYFKFHLGL